MESTDKIVAPNLNAEAYRNLDDGAGGTLPYLDYICIHSEGGVLIGRSELTGRHWNGAASVYESAQEAQEKIKSSKQSISLSSGTTDGCFIEGTKMVLICEDSGTVSIWKKSDGEWGQWSEELTASEHDDAAMMVACLVPGTEYVTVGSDGNAKVWDINEMLCTRSYNAAHSAGIPAVSVRPLTNNSFATGSLDYNVILWDQRTDEPALDIAANDCGVRTLAWMNDNHLAFGDEAGVMSLADIRTPKQIIPLATFPAAVHRVVVHTQLPRIAVCCDNRTVSVCDLEESSAKVIFQSRQHSNYVRGLAWDHRDTNVLYSTGWDGELKTHTVK